VFLALAQCSERVGRLAGLRHRHDQHAIADDRLAVAVLAREVRFDRNPRELLDHRATDHAGVVRGAARDELHALDRFRLGRREVDAIEIDARTIFEYARADRVGDRARLLVDLLLHEAVVAALLRRNGIPRDDARLAQQRTAFDVVNIDVERGKCREVAVLQERHPARVGEQRRNVAAKKRLAIAHAEDDRRAALLGGDDLVGLRIGQYRDRVRADHTLARASHGGGEIGRAIAELAVDQVRDEFRVGVGLDLAPFGLELDADRAVVLDDAVVHHRDVASAMRMRVAHGGLAVRGPARVTDADRAGQRVVLQQVFERGELAHRATRRQRAALKDSDARRVVAAVFEAA